jgi:D-tyrosyl-tRNA(Tyr) deacylase
LRAVIQRVSSGKVSVENKLLAEIKQGLVVLLGISQDDEEKDVDYIAEKIANLRIFSDKEGKPNLSITDIGGEVLVVSQFTLLGDCRKGRRPSFAKAAQPNKAFQLYMNVIDKLRKIGLSVKEGQFQAIMALEIVNDGPVTILLDSYRKF